MPQIGWLEILSVVIIAILVLGPKDFPIALKKIGTYFAKLKNTISSFQREVNSVTEKVDIEKDLTKENLKEKYKDKLSKKWDPYLKYMPLEPGATESEILEFFQRGAESICGMCPANPKKFHHRDPLLPTSFYEKNNFVINYE